MPVFSAPGRETVPRRILDRALITAFLVAICLPLVHRVAFPGQVTDARAEMRQPAPRPEVQLTWESLERLPAAFEAYYGDTFGLRSHLIRWHNILRIRGGATPSEQLVLGRDGWLFTTRENSIEVYRGVDPFTDLELRVWQKVLEERRAWLAERGIDYLFAVAPNKSTIYPEKMPASLAPFGPTRLEQMTAWFAEHSDLRVLDLTDAMLAAKQRAEERGEEVYYPYGTHWNRPGMFAGYRALLEALRPAHPALVARKLTDFDVRPAANEGDNWGSRLYMEDLLHQRNVDLVPREPARATGIEMQPLGLPVEVRGVEGSGLPRAILYHDSFGNMQKGLLAEHFERIAFYYAPGFDTAFIERERPDVVIHLMVERALGVYRPATSPIDAGVEAGFEASSQVLARWDPSSPEGLEPEDGATFGAVLGEDDPGVEFEAPEPNSRLLLPAFEVPSGHWPVLSIDLDAPGPTELGLEFMTEREPYYSLRSRLVRRRIEAGRQRILVKLLVPGLYGRLRLRPGVLPGRYVLRSFEVRAVPQDLP